MIVFDLECSPGGHRFEGWFGSSDDFAQQQARGLVTCPQCGSVDVGKALMAPRLARKGNQRPDPVARVAERSSASPPSTLPVSQPMQAVDALPLEVQAKLHAAVQAIASAQAEALKASQWVGNAFAEDARAMYYGEKDATPIHGQATRDEAEALIEEGIAIAPILFPVAPPDDVN